ncbi:GTPase of the mitochondrial inner membrane that associates with the large ribosomal subunit [Conoideocrella luteorostrata]|uniref:GTPase of the mitochondrial inner membrane that associates with the large ribosomal subunit n=1 Tax=Conoideocrella luteorostrata TaxID=1105319 RepID=A0AAJ0CLK4_9HYPO|nr:GTPase of the mitochondrial inner membrane that associates with the large ribosomal subunit [Conoideocrella luteorostrata]
MPLLRSVAIRPSSRISHVVLTHTTRQQSRHSSSSSPSSPKSASHNDLPESRLNPRPDDYASPNFADKANLTLYAGRGGNGCVSFLREAFLPDGPPNGGDGGTGGNIYIQAAHGETSLHKLARRRFIRAGRGKHGQGSAKGGARGEDIVITVPVGTIVHELERQDPAAEEAMNIRAYRALQKEKRKEQILLEEEKKRNPAAEEEVEDEIMDRKGRPKSSPEEIDDNEELELDDPSRHKWLLYPGMSKSEMKSTSFPRLPRRHALLQQPPAPIYLDLSRPTPRPILLAAGGIGGLGNPHFTSREHPKPIFATKGDEAVSMKVTLELKLLADVGLVGLPNAGKSTLLRALTNSRTRVGSWAFTTLQPNIGTVVLDKYSGHPTITRAPPRKLSDESTEIQHLEPRTRFTVADIPGLIEGAHLDHGLGIAFLRHVERAGVLAFVVDLSAGNAVTALKALWHEVGMYAQIRDEEERDRELESHIEWEPVSDPTISRGTINLMNAEYASPAAFPEGHAQSGLHIAGKPWFVVATKADLPDTQANFAELQKYLEGIAKGEAKHPSGVEGAWTDKCTAIPVSAIYGQGVDRIVHWTVGLLDE